MEVKIFENQWFQISSISKHYKIHIELIRILFKIIEIAKQIITGPTEMISYFGKSLSKQKIHHQIKFILQNLIKIN